MKPLKSIFSFVIQILILHGLSSYSQNTFSNPILRGSHPDPSICRVGDTYYMVNSTFEYFPGLPIHKSKDLVNWELIGYGLNDKQHVIGAVNLKDVQSDGGIHAPTIRYHHGRYFIITTNVYYNEDTATTEFVNFIITAKNPQGPWSEPHILKGAPGIDPDIFFDDNGKVWYAGTHSPSDPNFEGEGEIWLQEIDLENWALKGERFFLWRGACGGLWSEGPHLYKHDNRYYLMIAEGGTSFNHAVMIAVSDNITGPYISNERNPIFSTRHLSYDNWVNSTGHGDLFQTHDGQWYMVALGIRGDEQRVSNMGRESFLLPVKWEEEPFEWKPIKFQWPVIAPKTGRLLKQEGLPFKNQAQRVLTSFRDDFNANTLKLNWNFRRVPIKPFHNLKVKPGFLRIIGSSIPIQDRTQTSLMGFRQKESDFSYEAKLNFKPLNIGSAGGVILIQKDDNYISYLIHLTDKGYELRLEIQQSNQKKRVEILKLDEFQGDIALKVLSLNKQYTYFYKLPNSKAFEKAFTTSSDLILSKGYTGAFLGLYCKSNGAIKDYLDADWVEAKWVPRP